MPKYLSPSKTNAPCAVASVAMPNWVPDCMRGWTSGQMPGHTQGRASAQPASLAILALLAASLTLWSDGARGDESGDVYQDTYSNSGASYDPYGPESYDQSAYPLSNNDTRLYLQAGPSVVRESSYDLTSTYGVNFDPMYARSFAVGFEQDLFSGFGINLSISNVTQNFEQVTDSNGATWSVTGGDYRALAVTPGVHFRLENDVLEPYIHLGLGRASYDFSGSWNGKEYANKDNALIYTPTH